MGKTGGRMDGEEDDQANGKLDGGGMGRSIDEGVRARVRESKVQIFFFFLFE